MKQNNKPAERAPSVLLYAELRNFTRLSEVLEPARVLELASDFFSLTGAAVQRVGGEVCALMNDSVLAAFRTGALAQRAPSALQAAQALLGEFGAVSERWHNDYGFPAALAFGIHAGDTTFGMAGPKGAEQYIAFGDTVSVAERLVHRARAGEIVISGDAMKALGASGQAPRAEPLPALKIGRRAPIPIYGILLDTRLDFT